MVVNYFTQVANYNNIITTQLVATNLQSNFKLIKLRFEIIVYLIQV